MIKRLLGGPFFLGGLAALALLAAPAWAQPTFPPLSGRVVDQADILSAPVEAQLTQDLAQLEAQSGRQLVVATLADLQGYEIEDYGYQLGRAWGLGDAARDDGALLIVAPNERSVRIEVGYGLEPVLTDALSSVIIQGQILPRFRAGDMEGGVVAGVEALSEQLLLPEDQALAAVEAAEERASSGEGSAGWPVIVILFIVVWAFSSMARSRRYRRSALGSALPWIILGGLHDAARGSWSGGGGRGGFGGGGFRGGGGSFGGGGASGRW